jgi:hypothetical protein
MYLHMLSLRTSQIMFDSVNGAIMHCWKVIRATNGNIYTPFQLLVTCGNILIFKSKSIIK